MLLLYNKGIRLVEHLVLTNKVKCGSYVGREVADLLVSEALLDYLTIAKRLHMLKTDAPMRIVAAETGSIMATQDVLDHKNLAAT